MSYSKYRETDSHCKPISLGRLKSKNRKCPTIFSAAWKDPTNWASRPSCPESRERAECASCVARPDNTLRTMTSFLRGASYPITGHGHTSLQHCDSSLAILTSCKHMRNALCHIALHRSYCIERLIDWLIDWLIVWLSVDWVWAIWLWTPWLCLVLVLYSHRKNVVPGCISLATPVFKQLSKAPWQTTTTQ